MSLFNKKENDMKFKKLYFQKEQAQLECWKADLIKLNSKALLASAEIRIEMNKQYTK
jgi:hypothetical protein